VTETQHSTPPGTVTALGDGALRLETEDTQSATAAGLALREAAYRGVRDVVVGLHSVVVIFDPLLADPPNLAARLREVDRLKDEFIGMFSHELRTPLASILGYAEILIEDGVTGPDADHCVEVIDRNAKRLLRLAGDLQLLSQINSGHMSMEFRSADLADLAACAVEEMRPEAERKHIDLVLSATAVPHLAADPTRIAQLLGNLLSNAVKFTPDGGKVEVRLGTEGDQAVLEVADSGIGIPAADRERIFDRFFRTALATQQAIQGTGLGLAITKAIVEAHNGTIAVDSDEGRGSTFTVRLPHQPPVSRSAA